jgi:hypothetical protein
MKSLRQHDLAVSHLISLTKSLIETNLAFEQLGLLVKISSSLLTYGDLKTNPSWDSLRKDPRFDKLLAELAPRD